MNDQISLIRLPDSWPAIHQAKRRRIGDLRLSEFPRLPRRSFRMEKCPAKRGATWKSELAGQGAMSWKFCGMPMGSPASSQMEGYEQ